MLPRQRRLLPPHPQQRTTPHLSSLPPRWRYIDTRMATRIKDRRPRYRQNASCLSEAIVASGIFVQRKTKKDKQTKSSSSQKTFIIHWNRLRITEENKESKEGKELIIIFVIFCLPLTPGHKHFQQSSFWTRGKLQTYALCSLNPYHFCFLPRFDALSTPQRLLPKKGQTIIYTASTQRATLKWVLLAFWEELKPSNKKNEKCQWWENDFFWDLLS